MSVYDQNQKACAIITSGRKLFFQLLQESEQGILWDLLSKPETVSNHKGMTFMMEYTVFPFSHDTSYINTHAAI